VFPPEPPVAVFNLLERSAAGKGARQRGEANPSMRRSIAVKKNLMLRFLSSPSL